MRLLHFLLAAVVLMSTVHAWAEERATPGLADALKRIDDVARHYSSQALRFTSDEKIVVQRGGESQTHRFRHIYVVNEDGKHDELRVPVKIRHKPEAVGATTPYSWIFLFEAPRRPYVELSWVGIEERLGREAIGIAFAPRGRVINKVNNWYGVGWFDRETYLPLVFEAWSPDEHERKLELEQRLVEAAQQEQRSRSVHFVTSVRAEFREERNGLRLPTKVTMRETKYVVWGKNGASGYRDQSLASLKQLYTNYRFYEVETEQVVTGGDRP